MDPDEAQGVRIGHDQSAWLSIGKALADGMQVPIELGGRGMRASGSAYLVGGLQSLSDFFDDLATHWRGWQGAKDWEDAEGDVSMAATHDGKGQVLLQVNARNMAYEGPGHWRATTIVLVEPGALERVAAEIRLLLLT